MNAVRAVVVMGVAGAGKTVIGRALAERLGWTFVDGDDHHPAANRAKMAAGTPLGDDDRWPWLDGLRARIEDAIAADEGTVLACSALKRAYRVRLGAGDPRVAFLFLDGDPAVIAARLRARRGHFMPAALLDSQFAALEAPDDAVRVDVTDEPEAVIAAALRGLADLDAARRSATDGSGGPAHDRGDAPSDPR